ncbi:MAG: hypothetical protein RQ867_08600 [Mariprofundaceae bacterium]|nr:hypothetical protein [Mariprofundaceae bacterium]
MTGRLEDIDQRWTPDGSMAVIASLTIHRPHLGPARARMLEEQPMPLRAQGAIAELLLTHLGEVISIEGSLRRRYYSRDGEQRWGQVEIWVDACHPVKIEFHQER